MLSFMFCVGLAILFAMVYTCVLEAPRLACAQGGDVKLDEFDNPSTSLHPLIPGTDCATRLTSVGCESVRCPPPFGHGDIIRCPSPSYSTGSILTNGVFAQLAGSWSFEKSSSRSRLPKSLGTPDFGDRGGKKERDRSDRAVQRVRAQKAVAQLAAARKLTVFEVADQSADEEAENTDDGVVGPQLSTVRKPYRARRRLYEELVKEFGNSGNRDQAMAFKCAIHSRLPGHRKLIDAAFTEASREFVHIN